MAGSLPTPSDPVRVFDRHLVRRRRARAAGSFAAFDFLHRRVCEEIADRVSLTHRSYDLGLELGSRGLQLAPLLAATGKVGRLFRAAASEADAANRAGCESIVADEEWLPFADGSLDLVVSPLAFHWVNDLPGALIQINRALKPDGLFVGALFGGETLKELRSVLADAELESDGGMSPRVSPFADVRDLGSLLQRAGFALPVTDVDTVTVRYGSALHLMRDLRGMGETNAVLERRKTPLKRATLMRAAALYQERFGAEDGRVPATFQIIYLTGWAPDASQPKPLRPGSARRRLADALGTREITAGEKATFGTGPSADEET